MTISVFWEFLFLRNIFVSFFFDFITKFSLVRPNGRNLPWRCCEKGFLDKNKNEPHEATILGVLSMHRWYRSTRSKQHFQPSSASVIPHARKLYDRMRRLGQSPLSTVREFTIIEDSTFFSGEFKRSPHFSFLDQQTLLRQKNSLRKGSKKGKKSERKKIISNG